MEVFKIYVSNCEVYFFRCITSMQMNESDLVMLAVGKACAELVNISRIHLPQRL